MEEQERVSFTMGEVRTNIEKIAKLEMRVDSAHNRLDHLEKHTEAIIRMGSSIEHLANHLEKLAHDVAEIKQAPGEKWNTLINVILSSFAGAFIAWLFLKGGI